ncbi:MAG: Cna B-type domain-containing protein, partial [Prevotella sp.]|nr:Cna B-type domain-containing protein [Prevotella sp.]
LFRKDNQNDVVKSFTLTSANADSSDSHHWIGTFNDLDHYDQQGDKIEYVVRQKDVANYVSSSDSNEGYSIKFSDESLTGNYAALHLFFYDSFKDKCAREGDDPRSVNFVKNISSVYLWDSTTVVLHGRVVGGEDQGTLPLGQSLSKNNLGDSLKIVMQLEGDNASYLIRKQDDETVTSADYVVAFGLENANGEFADTTKVNVTRHTLTIKPDPQTGEYQLALHPAKYKVIEVSAQGYATLFQSGQVGETVDLTFNSKGDTVVYNRIYHAIPDVEVTQYNSGGERYFGVKKVTANDNLGNKSDVNLVYYTKETPEANDSIMHYSFGHPVFMGSATYGWILQACEKYYWNNDPRKKVDIVKLHSGKVSIKNYLIGNDDSKLSSELELDEDGGASYVFTPNNTTFVLEGDSALKTVDITLEYDGSYYDVKPLDGQILKGFVMATKPKTEGRKSIAVSTPLLFDILRDPPGGSSYSYMEAGSKLSYSYAANLEAEAGFKLVRTVTTGAEYYKGMVAAPEGQGEAGGEIFHQKKDESWNVMITTDFTTSWQYNYNMELSERIQTKSGQKWVAGKADLFMGSVETVIVQDALAVRAIPDSMYQIVKGHEGGTFEVKDEKGEVVTKVKVPVGTTKVLATGTDGTGKPVYLVRDEVMQASPAITSTFVHSQHYIENELLPDLFKVRNSMILPKGTDVTAAKALANEQGRPTFISQVDVDDEDYGVAYDMVFPDNGNTNDTISIINQNILTWVGFLAKNEDEKISVMPSNLVKRYDFDGAANIQYSELFAAASSDTRSLHYPGVSDFGSAIGVVGMKIIKAVETFLSAKGEGLHPAVTKRHVGDEGTADNTVDVAVPGSSVTYKHSLILDGSFNDKFGQSETESKKIGFNLAASSKSSLTVDVYRTETEFTIDTVSNNGQNTFNKISTEYLEKVRYGSMEQSGLSYVPNGSVKVYSNFVFRTVGGVTCQPYEPERKTKWYQPGTVIDVATIPADKPHIWIDEPVVSNVPYGEPARFVLHMANETDYPERATLQFNYFLQAGSNPNGATVCVDGAPLTAGGVDIVMWPAIGADGKHNVFTKEITVYPSKAFDYEDLAICLMDPEDNVRVFTQKFSAHFIPTAGKVNVSVPSNNWVINTESPYDGKRQAWYMPVRIEGFDINWPNFDHIELQYKLSTQGDKDWVNVCSYYADKELQSKASGVTDTIPSSGIIVAPFYGEVDPVEQYYDIRAVNYCRHAGGYLTGSSEVLKGIKDTRRPTAFGTPEPTNGILGIGDDILIKFSEPIAGNYLREINNFEVLGTLLSNDISTSTSLSFDGNALAATQGERNLTGKSFTVDIMLNPAVDQREMTVFSHGGDEKGMRFGVTADKKLSATINGETLVSDTIVPFNNMLHQVAYVLDQSGENTTVKFYDGSKAIGSKQLSSRYEGASSEILLGADFDYTKDILYKGEMLEFRLWNRAMSSAELDSYGKKRLTGYETGLLDYYPLNEGEGTWGYDKAAGSMDLMLAGTSWKRPVGISMEIKGDKGLRLKPDKFARSKNHDYTLSFWFRTNDENATLFSNGEAGYGQDDQLNIGIKDSILYVRSQGFERKISAFVSEGSWHHFAMTVSRSQNVSNVYVDKALVESFPADSVGGILGNDITLGATFVDKAHQTNVMTGHIDEVGMFESVLPINLINEYSNHTPIGTMNALMAYLDFGRSEKQDDNQQHLEPTGISIKRYVDSQGKVVARRDTLVADEEVEAMASREFYAPMVSNAQLDNLNYSFVANGNELYMNIKEPDYMVEKTNIYVTVKDVLDLQGNTMASPITMNLYVYRNPLRWDVKHIDRDVDYGSGTTFEATVKNLSGLKQNFRLTDLPLWISASQTDGTIDALDEQTITFTVNDYINIGTYNEQIALIGDNTMSEPLPITLRVRGDEPEWTVSDQLKQANQTMMMVARVKIDGVVANSSEDIVAVFDENQQVLGVSHIEVNNKANANEALAYLTIFGYTNPDGSTPRLFFRFFDASSGKVYSVKPDNGVNYSFEKDAIVGTDVSPVIMKNSYGDVQTIKLKKGWNWVTFYVVPNEETTLGHYLNSMSNWEVGDMISAVSGTTMQQFTCRADSNAVSGQRWDDGDQVVIVNPAQMYNVYSMSDKTIYLEGEFARRYITVHKDWNRIGYISKINLPIAQALADYTEKAQVGDVVKSQDGFAIASQTSTGLVWKGSLQYLEVGKGYMMKRLAADEVQFLYPLYYNDSRYSSNNETRAMTRAVGSATTMNIVAAVDGVEIEAGDKLVVFSEAERQAEAVADAEQNYYLNIGSDNVGDGNLTFVIEREGETIAMTNSRISYAPNKVLGTPEQPIVISFTAIDNIPNDGKWYTVGGILVGKKPTKSGVYIHDGKTVIIKK